MMNPAECKWCGCGDVLTSSEAFVHFGCGSGYWPGSDQWTYAGECVGKCAARVAELEERIKRAIEVLEKAERHEPVIDQHGGIDWLDIPEGMMMLSEPANEAIAILKGGDNGKAD